ncbi:hypothetical protein GLOTRDRAFT_95885 [Gloeophyllum trabeum ATCC 11539]|uniref:F-box domain-containing protein n=1 Tax=Gloeophyllum trabeum (strain ATCC 11539 / FP-39264 / Madison 617) TaxID=670483 RepID=S7RI25_GLOTA|nr:uncharacterized protein GLOTRDRAFT_95885 [Gloeophyllum trabeum ATCC 11539]EPQ52259.1 hypothetical protein GLOTRDRAFT_95885 [Gloeophyllum trabeum ATCC 11539]
MARDRHPPALITLNGRTSRQASSMTVSQEQEKYTLLLSFEPPSESSDESNSCSDEEETQSTFSASMSDATQSQTVQGIFAHYLHEGYAHSSAEKTQCIAHDDTSDATQPDSVHTITVDTARAPSGTTEPDEDKTPPVSPASAPITAPSEPVPHTPVESLSDGCSTSKEEHDRSVSPAAAPSPTPSAVVSGALVQSPSEGCITSDEDETQSVSSVSVSSNPAVTVGATPIDTLPDELLLEVWRWAFPACQSAGCLCTAPWPAHGVCRRWRAIILSSASFWTIFHVPPQPATRTMQRRLSRSKHYGLHVNIVAASEGQDCLDERLVKVVKMLVQQCHRWKTCRIDMTSLPSRRAKRFLSLFKDLRAPRLVELTVLSYFEKMQPVPFANSLPALTKLVLRGPINLRKNLHLLSGLTTLVIDQVHGATGVTHHELQAALANCPGLTRLTMDGAWVDYDPSDVDSREYDLIHLPSLEFLKLTLAVGEVTFVSGLFRHLSAPALRTLKLHEFSSDTFDAFIAAISCDTSPFRTPYLATLSLFGIEAPSDPNYAAIGDDGPDGGDQRDGQIEDHDKDVRQRRQGERESDTEEDSGNQTDPEAAATSDCEDQEETEEGDQVERGEEENGTRGESIGETDPGADGQSGDETASETRNGDEAQRDDGEKEGGGEGASATSTAEDNGDDAIEEYRDADNNFHRCIHCFPSVTKLIIGDSGPNSSPGNWRARMPSASYPTLVGVR